MISEKDFDQLSAYLDHQLSDKEKQAVEARLLAEPELKATLRDLRLQARALRELPKLKVPRNFTLTAKQAEAIRPPRRSFLETLFPTLRLATSLSATAFVVLLTISVLNVSVFAPAQTASQPPQEAVALQPQELSKEAPVVGGAAPASQATNEAGNDALFATTDGSETPLPELGIASLPITDTLQNATVAVEPEATATADAASARQIAEVTGTPDLGNQVFIPAIGGNAPATQAPPPAAPDTTLWLIGLGVLTAILAAITWLIRRRS